MKPIRFNPLLRLSQIATLAASLSLGANAGTLYWDGNGTGATGNPPTANAGGNGTWDAGTTANWWDGTTYQLWNATGGQDIADFRGTAGTATVSGTVNVNKINIATSGYFISGGTINFAPGGILDTNNTGTLTLSSTLSGSLVANATASTINLSGSAGILISGNNTGLTSFELALNNANNHIIIDSSGALGAAGAAVKFTTGIVNLGNLDGVSRTYNAWTTELAGGTIRGRFASSTLTGPITVTANSGMESRNGANAKLILASTATINLNANALKLSAQNSAGSGIELNGNISGTDGILNIAGSLLTNGANGSGIVTLAGTNTYTGGTNVTTSGALLNLRKLSSLPTTGTTAMSTGTTLSLGVAAAGDYFSSTDVDNLFAGTTSGNLANVTLTGTVHVGIDTTAGDFTYGSSIPSVAKNLFKLGANKLTLTGTNTYTGSTTIYEGTLTLSGTGTIGTGALNINGGNLDLGGFSASTGAVTVTAAAPAGDTVSNGSITTTATTAAAYQATNTLGNAIISANLLANSTAGFTKTGAGGIVTLSGTNTYTGGTTVTTGTLTFLNTAAKPATGTTTPAAAATLGLGVGASPTYFTAADVASLLAGTLTNVSGTNAYTVGIDTSAGDFDYSSNLGASTRAITKLGANALTLSGTNAFDKLITVSAGTLKAGSASAFTGTGNITVQAGTTFDLAGNNAAFTNITTSTGTITTTGAGSGTDTLTISALTTGNIGNLFTDNGTRKLALNWTSSGAGAISATTNPANTFSGGLSLGSAMRINPLAGVSGSPGAIVSGPFGRGAITISNTAQIFFNGANQSIINDVVVNGNAGNGSRTGSFRIDTTGNTVSGTITASAAPATFHCGGNTGTITLTGQVTGTNGLTVGNPNGTSMKLTLNNATANLNNYSGNTTNSNTTSTIALGAADQIPNGTGKGNVAISFGTLDLAGFSETINGLTGAGNVDNVTTGTSNTLTIGDGDATGTAFSGVIKNTTGVLSVTKTGTGTQTLGGVNTYSGATTINGGTLALGATGTIANTSEISISTGAKLETVLQATYAMPTGKTVTFGLNAAGAGTSGQINAAGLDITNATVAFSISGPLDDAAYVLATYTSKTGTAFASVTAPSGYTLDYAYNGGTQIALVQSVGTPYDTWINGYTSLTGLDKLSTADPDKDGLINQQEFAFGLIPDSGSSVNPITAQLNKTTGQFTYQRLAASGLSYTVWTSTDLATWTQDLTAVQTPTLAGPNESVQVTLSGSLPLADSKLFVRIKAE